MKTSDWNFRYNERFVNVTYDQKNDTHYGLVAIDVFQPLSQIRLNFYVKVADTQEIAVDHTINLCSLQRERRSNIFVKLFFDANERTYDFSVIKCPLDKGFYVLRKVGPRAKKGFQLPTFIPLNVKANFKLTLKSKVNGKVEIIYSSDQTLEMI